MTGRLASGVLAVAVSMAALPARAEPSAELQQRAAELVQKGIQLQNKHDIEGAVALYKEAYCLIPEPVLVYNIGTAYQEGKKPPEAQSYFRLYLKVAPAGDLAADAKAAIKQLEVSIKGNETAVASIPCPAKRPACLDGAQPVNGVCPVAPTCAPGQQLDGGSCVAIHTGGGTGGGDAIGPPPPHHSKTLFYAGVGTAGVGAIALGAGIAFGIKAKNASDALSHNMGAWTPELLAKQKEGKDAERNQIIFSVAGGAAIAGGAVMIILGLRHHDATETAVGLVPYATGDEAGVAFSGRY